MYVYIYRDVYTKDTLGRIHGNRMIYVHAYVYAYVDTHIHISYIRSHVGSRLGYKEDPTPEVGLVGVGNKACAPCPGCNL